MRPEYVFSLARCLTVVHLEVCGQRQLPRFTTKGYYLTTCPFHLKTYHIALLPQFYPGMYILIRFKYIRIYRINHVSLYSPILGEMKY